MGLIHKRNPHMLTIEGGPSSTLRMTPVLEDSYEVSIFNLKFDIVVFRDYSRNIGNSPFNATKGSRTARTGRGSNPIYDSVPPEKQNSVDLSHAVRVLGDRCNHIAHRA